MAYRHKEYLRVWIPEIFSEVEGVVHAALWQRPAEICLMFFPWRAVMSVGSFTWFECPRPSWNTKTQKAITQALATSDVRWKQTTDFRGE